MPNTELGQPLERGCTVRQAGIDHRLIPIPERKHARLHPHERIILRVFLYDGREPRPHRYLGALANVAE
jgi:hypothetical protein